MNARKCSGRLAYARKTFGTKPIFARVSSQIARMSSGMASSDGAPKREGAALCAAPSLNGGWLLRDWDVPTGDIDGDFLRRFVDVDCVRTLLQIGERHALDGRFGLPVVAGPQRVLGLRIQFAARAGVNVRRLVHAVGGARQPQLDDQPPGTLEQRRRPVFSGA